MQLSSLFLAIFCSTIYEIDLCFIFEFLSVSCSYFVIFQNQSSEILGTTEEAVKILGNAMEGSNKPVIVRGDNLCMNVKLFFITSTNVCIYCIVVEAQSLQGGDTVKFPLSKTAFNESDDTNDIKLNIPVGKLMVTIISFNINA